MQILTDEQYERLQNSTMVQDGKTLQGVHSYDILANTLYLDDFQYVTAAEPNRAEVIVDGDNDEGNDAAQSDLVRVALNLAYFTKDQAQSFRMDKKSFSDFVAGVNAKIN